MKKIYLVCLIITMLLTACGNSEENNKTEDNKVNSNSSVTTTTTEIAAKSNINTTTESKYEDLDLVFKQETHEFGTLAEMMDYIGEVKPNNDYIIPTTDNDNYTFIKGIYYDSNGVYYMIFSVDDVGTTLICSSVEAYKQNPDDHKSNAIEQETKNNGWLICDFSKYDLITGYFQATSDKPNNYMFIGLNTDGYEYYFDFIKNDNTDTTKDELVEIYNDFEFNTYLTEN